MKVRMIIIEGRQIGIAGLDEVLEELSRAGKEREESLKNDLLIRLKKLNYIPLAKEKAYASAFLEEYRKFSEGKTIDGENKKSKSTKTWQGIPREEVHWYPTIRDELCDGCKICLEFCSFGVYQYDEKSDRVKVANPFNCVVGCSMCALKCKPKAIMFPPLTVLETFRKR
jgi:NAD-dependent dihydropyrimidine dehydrogenase PreA subunit